jgi:hypothetical protein
MISVKENPKALDLGNSAIFEYLLFQKSDPEL